MRVQMMNINKHRINILPSHQRGIATILISLFIGLAVTATALSTLHDISSTQDRQLGSHAQTHAQSTVWTGAEAVRMFLLTKNASELMALETSNNTLATALNVTGVSADTEDKLTAYVTKLDDLGNGTFNVAMNLSAIDVSAQSSSSIEMVYEVTPKLTVIPKVIVLSGLLDLYDNLSIGGDIKFEDFGSENLIVKVKGDIAVGGSVTGLGALGAIMAFGNMTINGSNKVGNAFANGNITMNNDSTAVQLKAVGKVILNTSKKVSTVLANKDVFLKGGPTQNVDTLGNITVSSNSNHGRLTAGGTLTHTGTAKITTAQAVGRVNLGNAKYGIVQSKDHVQCKAGWGWKNFTRIETPSIGRKQSEKCILSFSKVKKMTPDFSVSSSLPLQVFTMQPPKIDVWPQKGAAHYAFSRDGSKLKVAVRSIKGIVDGTYYLGTYDTDREYICKSVNANNKCTAPASKVDAKPICRGFDVVNSCFSYRSSDSKWKINGTTLAPGVMWFEGNVEMANGFYVNSIYATGNIYTSGQTKVMAVNYAGPGPVCTRNKNITWQGGSKRYNYTEFSYPTDICDDTTTPFSFKQPYNPSGNIAFMAGGYPNGGTTYAGGEVDMGNQNIIFGTIAAGNTIGTSGNTTIYGYLLASGLGASSNNTLSNTTKIKKPTNTSTYDPSTIPDGNSGNSSGGTTSTSGAAKVLWSRYR